MVRVVNWSNMFFAATMFVEGTQSGFGTNNSFLKKMLLSTMSNLTFFVSELDPCTPDPCQNGGACSVIEESSFECNCTENFQGDRCEIGMTYYKITE